MTCKLKKRFAFRCLIVLIYILFTQNTAASYKLNVPKVLLPFHSSKLISFMLEAKSESPDLIEEPCFVWSSSRPDIVSITPIYDKIRQKINREEQSNNQNECSSKAVVSAVSKHSQRFTSIILAKEIKTDKLIRCDVIVDKINSIRIKHTTTHLYLEDSPECFTVEALDDEGNTFSSIDGLPFEWTIINDLNGINWNKTSAELEDSRHVLRISKFIDSEYEVSESVRQLEAIGLSGNKILIEGLKTGTANVQSKLLDPVYKDELTLKTPLVRLLVVANILLEPSYPVFLLVGSTVKYNVFLIKQTSIEKVNLPSLQYYFESRNTTAADLYSSDLSGSTFVGLAIGFAEVVLVDRNMKEHTLISSQQDNNAMKPIVPPPTALVHVVLPDHLIFTIKNWRSSWILEVGRTYEIVIYVYNDKRQQIYLSDNLRIDAIFEKLKFKSNYASPNGSYHIVTGIDKGLTQAQASLIGTLGPDNTIQPFSYIARGQVDIELLDPISLKPKILVFAFCSGSLTTNAYDHKMLATGGSGSYYWQSRNTTIANVNAQGIVRTTATRIGLTEIFVSDTRNIDIQAKSLVYVLEPIDLQIQPCPVETQVGTQLFLNVKMSAFLNENKNQVHINDCSRLQFEISIQDERVFRFVSIQSPSSLVKQSKRASNDDSACAVIVLDAIRIGRSTIKLTTVVSNEKPIQLNSNEITIGSYSTLKSYKNQIVLSRGSSIQINLFDGPLLSSLTQSALPFNTADSSQSSNYESRTSVSIDGIVEISPVDSDYMPNKYSYFVKCVHSKTATEDTLTTAKISISHKQTNVNKCPISFEYDLKVVCAKPRTVQLNQLMVFNDENTNEIYFPSTNQLKWKCPIKLSSNQIAAHSTRPLFIQVTARDASNNVFDNFTSLQLTWKIDDKNFIEKSSDSLSSLVVARAVDEPGIYFFNNFNNEFGGNSQRVYYQSFNTKSKFGRTKLRVQLQTDLNTTAVTAKNYLESELTINFVSDVSIRPDALTIFNHPSNVVTLNLLDGSGYYHAEIETIRVQLSEDQSKQADQSSNVLKINQINENNIVVSPLVNNGLTYLHVYDYCVAPALLKTNIDLLKLKPTDNRGVLTTWRPSSSAKIQVSGINSILANYEDDKVEVKKTLKIFVQISDSTGNLIKTSYFPLMSLNGKLTNGANGAASNSNTEETEQLGSIELASQEEYEKSGLSKEERDFTAIYILTAIRPGVLNVQFEARGDGYELNDIFKADQLNLIQSQFREIQIFIPLDVQPKYIELIVGSDYQVLITGGPNSPDASIKYELINLNEEKKDTANRIIDINSDGIINAVNIGQMKVSVKSVGYVCLSSHTQEASIRCKTENKVQRVYSQDYFIVKVVELHSIQIHVPLRTIKVGNEMPVYLMGNEKTLTPLSFGACNKLKYSWKLNDQQIGLLNHQLLSFQELDFKSIQLNTVDELLFENSFVLRFAALKPGKIKISVRVELNGKYLTDSIDVLVFENAYFTHFSSDYFIFKYPGLKKQLKSYGAEDNEELLIEKYRENKLMVTPGSQFQIKTNFDKSAFKMSYHLSFNGLNEYAEESTEGENGHKTNKYCNNNTIQISKTGLITVSKMEQYKLKNLKHCSVALLVTVYINELKQEQSSKQADQQTNKQTASTIEFKQQTLVYEIKVKPIAYSMLKLNKKQTVSQNRLIRLDKQSIIKNQMKLNSDGFKLQWNLKYYDDLGDPFDVVNVNTKYTLNRHDLIDFTQINANIFVYDASGGFESNRLVKDQADVTSRNTKLTGSAISLSADAVEHSFVIRTIKSGRLVMQITPFAAHLFDAKDYLSLIVADLGENDSIRNLDFVKRIEANIGDFMCLNEKISIEEEENSGNGRSESKKSWSSLSPNVVTLISTENENSHYTSIGFCVGEGQAILKKGSTSDSTSKMVDVNVHNIDKIKFSASGSAKFITNVQPSELNSEAFNSIEFQTIFSIQSLQNQNCSYLFEKILPIANSLIPFKCSASLYSKSNRLAYLDRLIKTKIVFLNNNWQCEVSFVPSSSSLLYELIDANQDRTRDSNHEPINIKVMVDSKFNLLDAENPNEFKVFQVPFVPAFHVHTKQIQLPISRNSLYLQNLKNRNQKEFSLNEHFNLILYSTEQLYSHLILSTNCPELVQIKPLLVSRGPSTDFKSSVLKITYDIITSEGLFDLNSYASILQEQNGNLYVQITCSLTQQTERIPIKFQFGSINAEFKDSNTKNIEEKSWTSYLFGWIFDLKPNQVTSVAVLFTLTFITILFLLRNRPLSQQAVQQIAMNASAAAAAATAANAYRTRTSGTRENSSFNPYRYFTSFMDTGSTAYIRDPRQNLSNSSFNTSSPSSFSFLNPQSVSGSPLKKSPQKQSYLSNDQLLNTSSPLYQNQNVPNIYPALRSPRFSPGGSEQVRLFSVDSDALNTSQFYENSQYQSRLNSDDNY